MALPPPPQVKLGWSAVPSGSIDQKTFSVGYHLAREPGRLALLEDFKLYMARLTTNANQSLQPSDGVKQRGRPRDPAKREKLLATARTLFLKDGADAVTMDRIVAGSGLARATLYAYFRDKTELLEAVIARESERIVDGKWLEDARFLETRYALQYFGVRLLALIGDPEQLDCEKLISQAARKTPEYGRRFFAAGPGRSLILLTQLIEIGQANRTFAPANARDAALDLMALWVGFWRTEVLFGVRPALSTSEIAGVVDSGIAKFFRLYGL